MVPSSPTREQAVATVRDLRGDLLANLDATSVSLDRISGRVLAESVVAERDVPPVSQATMDGFAVATADEPPLTLRAEPAGPGDTRPAHEPGTAIRVRTGGPVPDGADVVVVRERATVADGELRFDADGVTAGQHVLERGSILAAGETVLESGRRLAPRDPAVLRGLGRAEVAVRDRLSTAVLATGTEIHDGTEPDRDSDVLATLARAWGGDPEFAGSVPDDPERVGNRIAALAGEHDVVLTTGGTGVAAADETAGALADRADVLVTDTALRPGSGTTVAWLPERDAAVVALPGPPGAMLASATVLVRPLFVGVAREATVSATAARDLAVPDRDIEFVVPVEFRGGDNGGDGGNGSDGGDGSDDGGGSDNGGDGSDRGNGGEPRAVPFGSPDSTVRLYGERYRPHLVSSCPHLSAAEGFVVTADGFETGDSLSVVPYEVVDS